MKPLQVAQDIVPIGVFKSQAAELLRSVRETGRPLVLTQNGRPAAVLVSPDAFDEMTARARLVAAVTRGIADADAGQLVGDEDLGRDLDEAFGSLDAG